MTDTLTAERIAEIRAHHEGVASAMESKGIQDNPFTVVHPRAVVALCDLARLGLKVEAAPVVVLEDMGLTVAPWRGKFDPYMLGKRVRIVAVED